MSGFEKQTYTQVPNSLFEIMGEMDECELKVVLYVCRLTFGYHRQDIKISTRKMAEAIGMNTASVQKGAELAEKRGLIERITSGHNTTEWRVIVEGVSESDTASDEVYQNLTQGVSEFESQVGLNKDKERVKQNKKTKIVDQANKTVNGILEADKQARTRSWSLLPEPFHLLAKAFCDATTLTYHKKFANDWMATISDWMTAGYTPDMITAAVRDICDNDSHISITRPGSLDWKLRDMTVKRANVRPIYPAPTPLPPAAPSGPAITREEYERMKKARVTA